MGSEKNHSYSKQENSENKDSNLLMRMCEVGSRVHCREKGKWSCVGTQTVSQEFEQSTMQPSNYTFRYSQEKNIYLHSNAHNVHRLLIILETWKQPKCLSDDEEKTKILCIHIMEYYVSIKKELSTDTVLN